LETRLSQPPDEPLDTPLLADPPAEAVPMEAAPAPAVPARAIPLNWTLVLGIIVADQITKALIRASIGLYESVTVIPSFMDFTHVQNPGVAFGLLSTLDMPWKAVVTTALALVALAGIAYYTRHIRPEEKLARTGLALILGGAIGNLIDRLWARYVLDFVDVYFGSWHFWAFNIADASITIGAAMVFLDLLTNRHASTAV
jgi:signal peptidase II